MKSYLLTFVLVTFSGFAKAGSLQIQCESSLIEDKTLKSGCLWEKSGHKTEIKTLHFSASAQQSDYLIRYDNNKIKISNHLGKLRLNLRDGSELLLPAGFEVWISEIQYNKKNLMGIIEPINVKEHAKVLISIWNSNHDKFKEHFGPLVSKWGPNHDIASTYYKGLVQRKIASVEAVKNRKLRKAQQEREVRRRNKELLFDRAFSR